MTPPMHDVMGAAGKPGYSGLSIALHWLTAALFVTHEGEEGSVGYVFHVSGGAIAGVILLWRAWHSLRRGMAERPDQAAAFNLVRQVVLWGFVAAIVVVVISGYLLPWSQGMPLDLFGVLAIPSPMGASPQFSDFVEDVHDISGQAFPLLLLIHLLAAAKHAILHRDGVARRIYRPVAGGR